MRCLTALFLLSFGQMLASFAQEIELDPSQSGAAAFIAALDSTTLAIPDLEFGSVGSNSFPQDRVLAIRNTGSLPVQILTWAFPTGSPFSIISGFPITINPGGTSPIVVRFADPGLEGRYQDSLRLFPQPPGAPAKCLVSGTKVFVTSIGGPSIVMTSIGICNQQPRDTVVTILNVGSTPLTMTRLDIQQDTSFRFNPKPALPLTIPAGENLNMPIRYNPGAAGQHVSILRIESNALNAPVFTVSLSGRKELAELQALSLYFGNRLPAGLPAVMNIDAVNIGTVPIAVDSLYFGNAPPFQILGGVPAALEPGQKTVIPIRFVDPGSDGYYSDTLTIVHRPSCKPLRLLVAGIRISAPFISAPLAVEFGTQLCSLAKRDSTIEIVNTGVFDLIVGSAAFSGGTEFSCPSLFPKTIKPGNRDTIRVRFTPTGTGPASATLILTSNAANAPQLFIPVSARAEFARITGTPFHFGDVTPQNFPAQGQITVTNNSTIPITFTDATFQFSAPFFLRTQLPLTLPAGGSARLDIEFEDPLVDGSYLDSLTIKRTPQCEYLSVAVEGSRSSAPRILTVKEFDFGVRTCGGPSYDSTIIIWNTGGSELVVSNISFNGPDFGQQPSVGFPVRIQPSMSATIPVRYTPLSIGDHTATMTIESNSKDYPQLTIPFRGSKDSVNIAAGDLDFGPLRTGAFPATRTVTLTNTGNVDVTLTGATFFPAGPFVVTSPLPLVVPAGQNRTIDIRMTNPGTDGLHAGTLSLRYEPSCLPRDIRVSGVRESIPGISIAGSVRWPTLICETTRDTLIEIRNTGAVDLLVTGANLTGDAGFSIDPPITQMSIAPGDTKTLRVVFTASTPGQRNATLTITSNDPNNPSINTSLSAMKEVVSVQAPDISFGNTFPSSFPALRVLTIRNTGSIAVTIDSATFSETTPFQTTTAFPFILPAGDSLRVTVLFQQPASEGSVSRFLTLHTSPDCSPIRLTVTGSLTTANATMRAGHVSASAGEVIEIPIHLTNSRNILLAGATGFRATLRFNRTLLRPVTGPLGDVRNNERVIDLVLPLPVGADSILARLPFQAGLGDDSVTALILENAEAISGDVAVTAIPGSFKLTNICREGGARLINPDGMISLKQNRPNPFNPITEIEYEVIEPAHTRLWVINGLGRTVAVLVDHVVEPGRYVVRFNASSLPSGMYHYVLQTPTVLLQKTMTMVK